MESRIGLGSSERASLHPKSPARHERRLSTSFFSGCLLVFLGVLPPQLVWAQTASTSPSDGPVPIETRWDPLWGMKYFQNDKELSGPRLKSLLDSTNDPQTAALLGRSESDETWGVLALGASVVGSAVCLVIPGSTIDMGGWKISLPYLPIQVPSLALGVVSSFLGNASGAAKYAAVQRYNGKVEKSGPLTWGIEPGPKGLILAMNYTF